jgi:glycosyltransferase involved in cell wall biosynthesis
MKRRVLVTAFEIPGFGGASTAAYALFAKMQRDGLDVHYANLIQPHDVPFYRSRFGEGFGNPKQLLRVHDVPLPGDLFRRHDNVIQLVRDVAPDVIVAKGTIAAAVLGATETGVPLVHLLAGWPDTSEVSEHRPIADGASLPERPLRSAQRPTLCKREEAASIVMSNLAIASTPLVKALYERVLAPSLATRIYAEPLSTAESIVEAAAEENASRREFAERSIDLLFVASSWTRWEKNLPLLRKIADALGHLRVHVVGECPHPVSGATHHGIISNRRALLELMGNAKALVVPSLLDANPGVLFEAAYMGANVVASKCCGNWELCNENLLVERPGDAFIAACAKAVERRYPDHLDRFLELRSYGKLLEILAHV